MSPRPVEPRPGQESVWDYPRPPRLEASKKLIEVVFNEIVLARSIRGIRALETSHPPVYYIPPEDIRMEFLLPTSRISWCEWKGRARYFTVSVGGRNAADAAWHYPDPTEEFAAMRSHVAFYPHLMDACYLDRERVQPQAGGFYGGWITSDIVGPFKGEPGTLGW